MDGSSHPINHPAARTSCRLRTLCPRCPLRTKRTGRTRRAKDGRRRSARFHRLLGHLLMLLMVMFLPARCAIQDCHGWSHCRHRRVHGRPPPRSASSCVGSHRRRRSNRNHAVRERGSTLPSSSLLNHDDDGDSGADDDAARRRPSPSTLLAVITEPDACETDLKMERTYQAIRKAVSTDQVSLISVRVNNGVSSEGQQDGFVHRACTLTERLVELSGDGANFKVVCSSDLVGVAVQARAHGVHVKERDLDRIPDIRDAFDYPVLIGTSTHSVETALASYARYRPHYYFVGTCFLTSSHPEKTSVDQLEGPGLPGRVRRALDGESLQAETPRIFAIGGIDETNCDQPIQKGADGVAVIRAVLQANDPAGTVNRLQSRMKEGLLAREAMT